MKTLFDETRIGTLRLKNRLVRSATWEAMADETGRPTPRLIRVYRELASGGTGLIITSATVFTSDATRLPGMLALIDDSGIPAFQDLARAVHEAGAPVVLQLAHPGRNGAMWTPEDATREDIQSIVREFSEAALRAEQAGFDGVEVHAAHGYFLSQFLNARRNKRKDEYGGSLGNRIRFLLEIVRGIRAKTDNRFALLVKINCSDFEEDDGVREAALAACARLAEEEVSAIEVSGGFSGMPLPPPGSPYRESVFRDYAAEISRSTAIPVILVGLNRTPVVLEELLNATGVGYFSLSRPFLRQPDLARFWMQNPNEPAACLSCDACRKQPDGNVCPFREDPVRPLCMLE